MRWRPSGPWPRLVPEPRLALAIAAVAPLWLLPGLVGAMLAWTGLAVLVGLIVGEWIVLPGDSDLVVERAFPATVGIGDQAEGRYEIHSAWGRALHVQLIDELPEAIGGPSASGTLLLPGHATATLTHAVRGSRRGRHPLGRVALRARTALGLVAARLRFAPEDSMLVTPSVAGVGRFRLLALQHRLNEIGVRALRQRGEGTSFGRLREYVAGDDPRRVDWKATARRGRLIVREQDVEQSQIVVTLVDAGRSMTQQAGEFSRFEHALSAVLVLTDVAARSGDRVGTLVFDDQVRAFVPPQRGLAALRAVRDALVPLDATMTEPDYGAAFRALAMRQRRRALVVFFTDVMDVRSSRALLAYVGRSAARHLVVVVALRNDALFAAATPAGDRPAQLYESAAAEELLMARAEALERMRRSGVTVLDVSPQTMAAAVVNRYLELKARGSI